MSGPTIFPVEPGSAPVAVPPGYQLVQVAAPAAPQILSAAALAAGSSRWARPAAGALPMPAGVLVTATLPLPDGTETPVQLLYGPEHGGSVDAIVALVGSLLDAGLAVKTYQPRREERHGWRQGGGGDYRGGSRGDYRGGGGGSWRDRR